MAGEAYAKVVAATGGDSARTLAEVFGCSLRTAFNIKRSQGLTLKLKYVERAYARLGLSIPANYKTKTRSRAATVRPVCGTSICAKRKRALLTAGGICDELFAVGLPGELWIRYDQSGTPISASVGTCGLDGVAYEVRADVRLDLKNGPAALKLVKCGPEGLVLMYCENTTLSNLQQIIQQLTKNINAR